MLEGISVEEGKKMYLKAFKLSKKLNSEKYFSMSAMVHLKAAKFALKMAGNPRAASLIQSLMDVLNTTKKKNNYECK